MQTLLIGTGYVGRVVVDQLKKNQDRVIHTYNSRQTFPNSVHFDLLHDNIADLVSLDAFDTVIFTSNIEKLPDTDLVLAAMKRAFTACKDKRVIYTSSDAVFDGHKGNYTESDVTNPVTDYGRHKLLCEQLVVELVPNSCIVRPSYVYGYSLGKLDRRTSDVVESAKQQQTIHRFSDMYKSPVEVNFLAQVITTMAQSDTQGVLHAGGKRMSVYDFHRAELEALKLTTSFLLPDSIPADAPLEMLRDTSLDNSRLRQLFGLTNPTIAASLYSND